MIGIGGVGMSGVARVLLSEGVAVSGSDMAERPVVETLRGMGAAVEVGHAAENVPAEAGAVVISAAVKDENPELQEARRRSLPVLKYAEALGLLMREKRGVAVAGTHGKTTTTAMLACILERAGLSPSFVVGAEVPELGTSSREGSGEVFVAEACEYDRSFLNLHPRIAVITNIEEDHLDYYSGLDEIRGAFAEFARVVPSDGLVLVNAHDRDALAAAEGAPARVETFGSGVEADWRSENLRGARGRYVFDLVGRGENLGRVELGVPGVHNVLNALAAAAVAGELGVDSEAVRGALAAFSGAARRFEVVAFERGVTVIDDYAHHPTEIQATLKTVRDSFADGRLTVVFQPHQHSRTRFLLKDFARSFSQADRVIVPDIYFVRDSEQERQAVSARDLVRELSGLGYAAEYRPGWEEIVARLLADLAPGDVVVTMGAGDVYEVAYELAGRLRG